MTNTVDKLLQDFKRSERKIQEHLRQLNEADAPDLDQDLILKFNTIRSGRSFKDEDISQQLTSYFSKLKEQEKKLLVSFLDGVSQIVTGQIPADKATTVADSGVSVVASKGKVRTVKPNVVKPVGTDGVGDKPAAEDTASPTTTKPSTANPIQIKK